MAESSEAGFMRERAGRGGVQRGVRRVSSMSHPPVPEENVEAETETVFRNYIYQSYRNSSMRQEADLTPAVPELVDFPSNPVSPAAQIGRELARLGDDINDKYADVFDGLISSMHITDVDGGEDAYQTFAEIARRVLSGGSINWGRILILLSFGYRLVVRTLRATFTNFSILFSKIVSFVARFVISERISKWIADNGGWIASLSCIPAASSNLFWMVSGVAALSVLAVLTYHNFLR